MTTNIFYILLLSSLCILAYVATVWLGRCVDWLGWKLAQWSFEDEPDG